MRPVATWNTTASREILVRHTRKPIAEMLSTLVSGLVVLIAPVILLIGCGGGSSAGGGQTALGTPAISSVTVSCATTIIMTSQSGQCSAAVAGTGNYSSAVNWLVNNVIGGNATVGTISSAGLYSAPVTVPTPYTVTVTATSVSDITKSASSAILIAGTIAATPQLISAASGGTITVPDGSSVTIPADFLPADQTVTLSEMSILPQQPPDGFVTGVGTALRLTFSTPVKPLFRGSDERAENNSAIGLAMPRANTLSTVSFAISQEPATSGLTGAIGMVAVADSTNAISFLPINYSTIGPSSSFAFQASLLVGLQNPISSISVSAANNTFLVIPTGLPLTSLPKSLCWQSGSQTWSDFSTCSGQVTGQRVLVVVHGMMSCVENTYTPLAKYMQAIVPPPPAKPYGAIVGFDYDWTQHLKITNGVSGSGDQLVSLLEQIAQLKPSSIDIVAHSEGVPVSLYAASVMPMPDRTLIANFFGLAGPVLGTPVSEAGWADLAIYGNYIYLTANSSCPSSTAIQNLKLDALFQSPFIQDLQLNSASVNGIVQDVAAKLGGTNTRIFLAGGTNQNLGRWPVTLGNIYSTTGSPFGLTPNDGIVGLDSALAYGAGFTVFPFPPFTALTHTDLPGDPLVMEYIGKQVSGTASPHLTCLNTAGACSGPQNTQFTIAGTGFGTNSQNVQVYGQDATGTVTQFQTSGLLDSAGTISWQVPIGIQSTGKFSVFAFDSTLSLASNNVTQTIVPAITLTISPTVATLAPGGTQNFSAAVAGNSNTGVTWSVQEGTAGGSINSGGLYTAPLVSGVYHVIATSQADTAVTSSAVVTVSGSSSTITISPTSATVREGANLAFSATVPSGGGVDWSVQESSGGTITSSGIYTAPQTTGTFHIVATSALNNSLSQIATVTVIAPPPNSGEWTWMSGDQTLYQHGVYGTKGVPAAGNVPGSRFSAVTWIDGNNNLWLFGGVGSDAFGLRGLLNDLWMFNQATTTWTWVSGTDTADVGNPVYGTLGVPSASNLPGARVDANSWVDGSGNLWLFGGEGFASAATSIGPYLNDLWKFDPTTKIWTWMSGSNTGGASGVYGTQGVPTVTNVPGARYQGVSWLDGNGNFWLFGGEGHNSTGAISFLNDLWTFNPTNNMWTWVTGSNIGNQSPNYGTRGVAAASNDPGSRIFTVGWVGADGNLWLFGGVGGFPNSVGTSGYLNDLWKFDPTTKTWTWMSGSNTGAASGVYGTQGVPSSSNVPPGRYGAVSWVDNSGNLWLFGGDGDGSTGNVVSFNDLWEFNPTTGTWTWMTGSNNIKNTNWEPAVFGTLGIPAAANVPGSLLYSMSWVDSSGNLWLFGGDGWTTVSGGEFNDLWRFQP